MKIKLKELTLLPFASLFFTILMISISFAELEMLLVSYAILAAVLGCFVCLLTMFLYEQEMTKFGFVNFIFLIVLVAITVINGQDIKNAVYLAVEIGVFLLVFKYYEHRMKMIVVSCAIVFSICVYLNFIYLLVNPNLWIVSEQKENLGYLLGYNYNDMGIRLIVAYITNLVCLKFSKWWLLNVIPLTILVVFPLVVVQSMTSLSCMLLLIVYCLIKSKTLKRIGIIGLFGTIMLFQIFIVFTGKGIENMDFAVYIIEDVLGKDITFTGRTLMWDTALTAISKSPIFGYGYVNNDWYLSNMTTFAIGPHNQILSLFIFGGIILFLLYVVICTMVYRSLSKCDDATSLNLCFAIVVTMTMMLFEQYSYPIIFFLLILAYYYPRICQLTETLNHIE